MKITRILLTALFAISAATLVQAQSDLRIPISNPDAPGKLRVNSVFADDIHIRGYDGNEVRIVMNGEDEELDDAYNRRGLRKISSGGGGVEVTEENNVVSVRTSPNNDDLDLEIWVPFNFSTMVNLTHGDILIENVNGEHEVKATNGDVEMTGIGGSVICNSINGDIEVQFNSVTPDAPMSFNGLNGDIEVSFPANTRFNGKMKTDYGDIYTNFEMEIDRSASSKETSEKNGVYSVTINKWITGTVNGGGPEFLFKTMHGDIEISKN